MRLMTCLAAAALTLVGGVTVAQQAREAASPPAPAATAVPSVPLADGQHALTKEDADTWLDGFLPYALRRGDIAGAVVMVVKDGQVLTQRGFGYADVARRTPVDPATTMFRPGSVSKLYTWTAVMQLVEAGKINLDADINTYLDFKIPPFEGKPITMRQVMTHTPGFEEAGRDLIVDAMPIPTLEGALKRWTPARVYAPGSTPAYSNYATGLAGYIVERLSGMSFDDYVERNIFQRLGMTHATFRQPVPAKFQPFLAKGYELGSGDPKPYELVSIPPAGSSAISGADMAKFMIAHLAQGGPLLKPETAKLMHSPANEPVPGVNRMMLGFYEQKVNGMSAIAHGGDTRWFHSVLVLFPEKNTAIYISMNSASKEGAVSAIRKAFLYDFADRYFPVPEAAPKELPTAKEHAALVAGTYESSRSPVENWGAMLGFMSQLKIGTDKDGRLAVPMFKTLGGAPQTWIEVEPFVWQSSVDKDRFAAKVVDGKVVRIAYGPIAPFMVWDRAPWHKDTAWLMPATLLSLGIILLTALAWPIGAIVRRRYGATLGLTGRDLTAYRGVRLFSWLTAGALLGWVMVISSISSNPITPAGLIWFCEIFGTLVFFGLLAIAAWNALLTWKSKRGWFSKLWSALLVLAAFVMLWVALTFKLISFGANW